MGGWIFPQFMHKGINLTDLENEMLIYYHDNLHILWSKLEEGFHFEWTFFEVYKLHYSLVKEMKNRGINHLAPINDLDKTHYYSDLQEVINYSVEKKINGFHVSVHKKGNEVNVFSEQKKDLTVALPTLSDEIKKLSDTDFIIDGELVPYDEKGKALGRNVLMKYTGAVKSGKTPDDKNIKLHIWDIIYFGKPIDDLTLKKRIEYLDKLKTIDRFPKIERKIVNDKEMLRKAVNWASTLENSEGAVVKDLTSSYSFGENKSWRKYRKLTPLIVSVIKRIPKKRDLYNYLVGIESNKNYLDSRYIQDGKLVLGHTFNTDKIFEIGDKIKILLEEVWRHETKKGLHYSIHKPRIADKSDDKLSSIDYMEDIVTSVGVSVIHNEIEGFDVMFSEELIERTEPKDEGKEIEVKNFPDRMQNNFRKMIGKWGEYGMQIHTRGKTAHYDIRHKVDNLLEGITLFARSVTDRIPIESEKNNIRSTIKMPQPTDWLNFNDITHKGAIGATKEFPGIFTLISKGKYTVHEVEDHKIVIEYKSDKGKINKKSIEWAKKNNIPYSSDLPDNLIDLTGKYSWHIAHIGDRYIILFDNLKE